ncbi:FG-GAP-like repeat-containing protein [Catellatospora bangladeshensis]|uniref:Peptidase C51 domain-containing protein n=1 Tax=Catellatospora bangladeshensis TaxID=310355 RepID=A0A8J3NKR8_9ACTN|nr:FG-GAP-like repeat-containing protein [Catellatospora bangladeshensis]GIF83293.1 hypothetical protein Cba03nite_46420 [Catellatospora bangladeshensis]
MHTNLFRRIATATLGVAMAAGLGITATEIAAPAPAHAASSVGGQISRSEVLARAQWWIDTYGVIYSQAQADQKPSVTGDVYRPDCSGFVSMAWHLPKLGGWDRNTDNLATQGDTDTLGNSLTNLLPGDAILWDSPNPGEGHVMLFDEYVDSSKTELWVYEEYSSSAQGRHVKKNRQSLINGGYIGWSYDKITGSTGTSSGRDFDGDDHADILVRNATTKDLHLYRGDGAGGFETGNGGVIGTNWSAFDMVVSAGDFDEDGDDDVIARNATTKDLHLYRGNGAGGFQPGTGGVIGTNWFGFDLIFSPGDFDNDDHADLLARNATTKALHLYKGNGAGGFQAGTGASISSGWGGFDTVFSPGDFDDDGDADVIARNATTKDLHLYRGNNAGGFQSGTGGVIGTNWFAFDTVTSVGDFDNDNYPDVIARNSTTKALHLYKGNGAGGFQTGTGSAISSGWGGFDVIF